MRVPILLARSLNRILLPSMTWGYSFREQQNEGEAKREVRDVAMAELSMARNAVPAWKEDISKIRRSVEKATRGAKRGER